VTWGIDQIDFDPLVIQGDVLREDRNTAFAFQIVAVEDPLALKLRIAVLTALFEQAIDHGGFAVVDVCNDNDVSNVLSSHENPRGRLEV
jgi:hypothetical protein